MPLYMTCKLGITIARKLTGIAIGKLKKSLAVLEQKFRR
jgi:hypothetical protein